MEVDGVAGDEAHREEYQDGDQKKVGISNRTHRVMYVLISLSLLFHASLLLFQ